MATNKQVSDIFNKIKAFKGSKEEGLLKKTLKNVIESDKTFINLVIDSCNGKRGCAFSEASVELAPYVHDDINADEFGLIYMRLLFKLDILEDFIKSGVDAELSNEDRAAVFLTLLEFIRDRRIYGETIKEIIKENPSKTSLMIAFAQHLFSQLIPGKKYMVDSTAKQLPEKCPDCQIKLETGNTSIGSSFTWHGRTDILLNQTIAVTVVENPFESEDTYMDRNCFIDDKFDTEPAVKKMRTEPDAETEILSDTKTANCVVEVGAGNKDVLLNLHTIDQIVAEAVTNAFAQVNMNKSLENLFIPTIGCTADHASVFLYDPVNDILLEGSDLFNLWTRTCTETLLSVFSVVRLWLFLNFTTFTVTGKHLKDKMKVDQSKFHEYMKHRLKFYQTVETRMPSCNNAMQRPLADDLKLYCSIRQPKK